MAEQNNDIDLGGEDDGTFETDAVQANHDIQQGLGIGARELAAQRDPKGAVTDSQQGLDTDDEDEEDA